jgi:putative transposase
MTYLPIWAGLLYLAVITDVNSRKMMGWAFGAHVTLDLAIAPLI